MKRMKPETKRLLVCAVAIFMALLLGMGMIMPFLASGTERLPDMNIRYEYTYTA